MSGPVRGDRTRCRGCYERIRWIRVRSGEGTAMMICDFEPSPWGTVRPERRGAPAPGQLEGDVVEPGAVLGHHAAAEAQLAGETLYLPHWASCPSAAKFRKGRKRSRQQERAKLAGAGDGAAEPGGVR